MQHALSTWEGFRNSVLLFMLKSGSHSVPAGNIDYTSFSSETWRFAKFTSIIWFTCSSFWPALVADCCTIFKWGFFPKKLIHYLFNFSFDGNFCFIFLWIKVYCCHFVNYIWLFLTALYRRLSIQLQKVEQMLSSTVAQCGSREYIFLSNNEQ